jgi:hypothetical protein
MRLRSALALPAILAYVLALGLAVSIGCAGSGGSNPGTGGSSGSGAAGSGNPGTAGSANPGTAGSANPGTAGSAGPGTAGSAGPGTAGSAGPGTAGTGGSGSGAAGAAGSTGTAAAGGAGPAGTGGSGPSGASGSAGVTGAAGGTGAPTDGGTDAVCQTAQYKFEPKIPTIYVLVDRSGSEFTGDTTGIFFTLRAAALQVIQQLQGEVRFGLGVFTGQTGVMCPMFTTVATDINNYTKIAAAYNALGRPQFKAETPAAQVFESVKTTLLADTAPGQKYVLFVTDTETDYCDDGSPLCPLDSVTYRIQDLYAAGIGTFIVGLPSDASMYSMVALQGFANAGVGMPVGAPVQGTQTLSPADIANQCQGSTAWRAIWTAAGRTTGAATATYAATGGTAKVYTPDPMNQTALVNAISSVVAGVKSCTFDLGDVGGKSIKVDMTKLSQAHVLIEGTEVAQNATNGWSMASATQLVLNGTACTNWRMPNADDIDFQFPCSTIIFE